MGYLTSRVDSLCDLEAEMSLRLTTIDNLAAIGREGWNATVKKCPDSSIFQSYEWISTWWLRFKGDTGRLRVVAAFENDSLVGLAPLCEIASESGDIELVFLGDGHTSYQTFPVVAGRLDIVRALLEEVAHREVRRIDIALREIPQFSALGLCLVEGIREWDAWQQASITPRPRLKIRGNDRGVSTVLRDHSLSRHDHVQRRTGGVSVLHFDDCAQILNRLPGFMCQHTTRWAGTECPSLFEKEDNQTFYRELVEAFAGTDQLLFTSIELNSRPVAQHFGFRSRGDLLWYRPLFDVSFAHLSPEEMLLKSLVEYARDANLDSLDFTRDTEHCKDRFVSTVAYNVTFLRPANGRLRGEGSTVSDARNDQKIPYLSRSNDIASMSVLVLDAESRAGIEVVQSLGRAGARVDAAVSSEVALWRQSKRAVTYIQQPSSADASDFVTWLRSKCTEREYALVVPTTENSLKLMAELQDDDPLRIRACLPSRDALAIALSKQMTLELAMSRGVRVPQSRLISKADELQPADAYPVVLKPVTSVVAVRESMQRLDAVIARTEAERRAALSRLLDFCSVQEQNYISGVGVGVECLYRYGSLECCFVHERLHELPLTGGGSTYRRSLPLVPEVVRDAKRLLDALNWHGVAMVEFKRDADGIYWLMEINPRFWGSLALSIDAGVDFPRALVGLAIGIRALPQPKYQVGYFTRHFPSDVDWMKENWRADHQDPLLLTRPRLKSVVECFRPFIGRESWDHFDRSDLDIVRGQIVDVVKALVHAVAQRARAAASRWRLVCAHRRTVKRLSRKQAAISRLLFVCYGNICRSPFAEIMARKVLAGFDVASAGFYHVDRRTTPVHVQLTAEEIGIEMAAHRSQRLDERMVAWADVIVVMDRDNFDRLRSQFPQAREKVIALGLIANPATTEIPDPYLMDIDQTRVVLRRIQKGLEGLAALMGNDRRAVV